MRIDGGKRFLTGSAVLIAAVIAVMLIAEPFGKGSGSAMEPLPTGRGNIIQEHRLTATNRVQTWLSKGFAVGGHAVYVHVYVEERELHQFMMGPCHASYVGREVAAVLDLVNCGGGAQGSVRLHYASLGGRKGLTVRLTRGAIDLGEPRAEGRASELALEPNPNSNAR